jgi:hypothetical protein
MSNLVMDLEDTEVRNECTGEGQQQFYRRTERVNFKGVECQLPSSEDVNTEAKKSTLLRTITWQRLMKTN